MKFFRSIALIAVFLAASIVLRTDASRQVFGTRTPAAAQEKWLEEAKFFVESNCEGVQFGNSQKPLGRVELYQLVRSAFSDGFSCLSGLDTDFSQKIADGLAQLAISSKAPRGVRIGCTQAGPRILATSALFGENDFPSVYLNPSVLRFEDLKGIVFHELLHQTFDGSRQRQHAYDQSQFLETVQPCSVCCFPGKIETDPMTIRHFGLNVKSSQTIHDLSCKLCAGQYAESPARHAVIYALTEMAQGGVSAMTFAAYELRKAVSLDPKNALAWSFLGMALAELPPDGERDMRILGAFQRAAALSSDAEVKARILENPVRISTMNRVKYNPFGRVAQEGYFRTGYTPRPSEFDIALEYEILRALLRMVFETCGVADQCRTALFEGLEGMRNLFQKMSEINSKARGTARKPFVEERLKKIHFELVELYGAKLFPCVAEHKKPYDRCLKDFALPAVDWSRRP